jgi:hypothetical protein
MRDPAVDLPAESTLAPPDRGLKRKLEPVEFAQWVQERAPRLADRWMTELRATDVAWNDGVEALLRRFVDLFVEILPATLGPYREQVEPLWLQAAELFGQVAAQRGLAAGEVIEEFQILREALIRLLYAEPPVAGGARMTLRDILRINRSIDRGVTQASVGHTDALFFALFQGSGVPESLDEELREEVAEQLDAIHGEHRSVMRALARR